MLTQECISHINNRRGSSLARNISDIIEEHLKSIMKHSPSGTVVVQRSELAELFQCVPSQINYVISTRFSIERGYVVESKRGGGGYIRIRQVDFGSQHILFQALKNFPEELSQREAEGFVDRLLRENLLTAREAKMLRTMAKREILSVDLPVRDQLRARIMNAVLQVILVSDDT